VRCFASFTGGGALFRDSIGDLLPSLFPDLTTAVFGAAPSPLADLIVGGITDPIMGMFGTLVGGLAAMFAPLLALFSGATTFDEGGLARGVGLMPKVTIQPERVLTPRETRAFEHAMAGIGNGGDTTNTRTVTIHAPFTVMGGEKGGRDARDRLLELMS